MNANTQASPAQKLSPEQFAALGAPNTVYFRRVSASEAFDDGGIPEGFVLGPERSVVVVYRADGERLAIVTDQALALAAAEEHGYTPVGLH